MKRSFFQAAVVSILLYECTTWTLTKRLEKKLDGNYTRMLQAILNKSRRQHPTKHQLYGHLPPITKTIQVTRARHAGHCWRSRGELISDVLLWTPTYGRAKAGRPARTYIQQLCEDTGCNPEDLPEAMNDREKWRERVRDIRASSTTWWWWWWLLIKIWRWMRGHSSEVIAEKNWTKVCDWMLSEYSITIVGMTSLAFQKNTSHDRLVVWQKSLYKICSKNKTLFLSLRSGLNNMKRAHGWESRLHKPRLVPRSVP